jgi:hypothetical protein
MSVHSSPTPSFDTQRFENIDVEVDAQSGTVSQHHAAVHQLESARKRGIAGVQ